MGTKIHNLTFYPIWKIANFGVLHYVISLFFNLYLMLYVCVQTFNGIGEIFLDWELRPCLVHPKIKKKSRFSVTPNIWTHA